MAEAMRQTVAKMLTGIERYNPDNLQTLESYVEYQSRENTYDLEANLAVLKLYQFNPLRYNSNITCQILLKALTNFPHTDFVLCKCLLSEKHITGFHDSIRKFVCHVVGITFQTVDRIVLAKLLGGVDDQTLKHWVKKYGWREEDNGMVFIANQDENIKTKNITEKIDFENAAAIMAASH
ncbi:eukaryotic translation initiation factor 3 subunit K isoform X2 [Zootermopsis nevadensis]|uniref:eukaryotic translation initiation factor 3 subunit K isoform X2 n=1 Tax=Zootermopsis nevadensis TaxID=136037 RepID=UPI000B8ED2CC|nr:eukaryotic translation initiation factor 3 subunit K isoform X2 [Zootermopsis nevadensis]